VGSLALSERLQREHRLPGCGFRLDASRPLRRRAEPAASGEDADRLDDAVRRVALALDDGDAALPERAQSAPTGPVVHWMHLTAEPAPNVESRVRLGDGRDAFGQRRVVLDWRLSPEDSDGARRSLALLARAWAAAGWGRARSRFPEAGFAALGPRGSFHHMGTTRMHDDPKQGVCDRNARVHGVANLWVAGSSLFPTYGTVNPTLTIVALALRLAEHLRGTRLRGA
jgi:choline dehydrogenase-like flavoprotein